MNNFLRITPLFTLSRRLKSKSSDPKRVAEALKQFNRENKQQFGKLIKEGKRKKKREPKILDINDANKEPLVLANAKNVGVSTNDPHLYLTYHPSSEKNSSKSSVTTYDLKSDRKDDSTSKVKKSSKKKLKNTMAESTCDDKSPPKTKRKSSKEKLNSKIAETPDEDKSLKRKAPRKAKTDEKKSSLSSKDESVTMETAQIAQTAEKKPTENPDPDADNSRINVYVEESSQSCDVNLSETNENVAGAPSRDNIDDENDDPSDSIANPFSEYTLLNEYKRRYSPDQIYTETKSISPLYYPYPTVAHILTESMSQTSEMHLKRWKDNQISELGEQEFQVHSESLMNSAKILRKLILTRLRAPDSKLDIPPELQGCWESLNLIFPLFPKVKEVGKVTIHPQLKYKGMVDSIVEFRNKLVLVGWKKANKYVPSLEKTYDLPIQCAAYLGAINSDPSFPFLVDEILLVMSYANGMKADVFHVKTDQCQNYWKLWLDRLHTYHERTKKTEVKDIIKSDFGKLNIEEELARAKEESSNVSEPNYGSSQLTPAQAVGSLDSFLVADNNFPLFNEEKPTYTDQKFELGTNDQSVFKLCPAVTTILGESKSAASKFILERWKNNLIAELGVDGFENYQKNLFETGVTFHKLIQNHVQGNFHEVPATLKGCWDSLQPVLPLITDVKLTESRVVHEKLQYKGVIDCVAKFRDNLVVIDWKKSDKLKSTISMTYDAPLQIAAYIGAINFDSNYPFKVEEGLLVISYMDGSKADVYHLNAENVQKYWEQWLQRLRKYQMEANANCQKINY